MLSRYCCRQDLKDSRDGHNVQSAGIMFHSLGPMIAKEFSWTWIFDLCFGTVGRIAWMPDRSL